MMIEFLRPEWLWLAPAALLVAVFWVRRGRYTPWSDVVDAALLPGLLALDVRNRNRWPWLALALGWLLSVLALAGPAVEKHDESAMTRIMARVIILDLSPSMDSPDVPPSRLERARYKLRDLLQSAGEYQHGLVVFSGDAFTVAPVTADSATLLNLLDALSTDIMPVSGNRLDRAIELALDLISRTGASGRILLVTDGVGEQGREAARRVRSAGARLDILGVGTSAGAPIVTASGGFVRDGNGNILISGVDPAVLSELAIAGGGVASMMTLDNADLNRLMDQGSSLSSTLTTQQEGPLVGRRDVGAWLVLPLLPLALLAFRRGWLLGVLLFAPIAPDVQALGWSDLWLRDDQQAARHVAEGNADAALASGDPAWRGVAHYQLGDHAAALETFAAMEGIEALYNRGNALAQLGEYQAALNAFDAVLDIDPEFVDARFNRELVARLLDADTAQVEQSSDSRTTDPESGGTDAQASSPADTGQRSSSDSGTPGEMSSRYEQASRSDEPVVSPDDGRGSEGRADESIGQDGLDEWHEDESTARVANHNELLEEEPPTGKSDTAKTAAAPQDAEMRQALENWLRQVEDDPGGLLRRKFLYEHRLRQLEMSGG